MPIKSAFSHGNTVVDWVMNIFKSFTLKWWEGSLFKYSMISLGIVIGATWPEIFAPLRPLFLGIFTLTALYVTRVWWKQ